MEIRTGRDYRESLRDLKHRVFVFGEKVDDVTAHPSIIPHINSAAITYEAAEQPEYADLMTAKSHLTGETINRFTYIHQNPQDLVKKVKMLRMLGQPTLRWKPRR